MTTPYIDFWSLLFCLALIVIPIALSMHLRLGVIKTTLIAVARMSIQLAMVGFFLTYLFEWDNLLLTVGWLVLMIGFAAYTVTRDTALNMRKFVIPVFVSLLSSTFFILFYFNFAVIETEGMFEARYAIAIGGMLLGNSLRGGIIGIRNFYDVVRRENNCYSYHLALGATRMEALRPYLQDALRTALLPVIATMATMGLVFLPGMMTGQILGGVEPLLAIKYQIAIMTAIFSCSTLGVGLAILLTIRRAFDDYGMLHPELIKRFV